VDPIGRRPFLALDHRAAPMEGERVWPPVDVEAEEEHSVAFHRFHCMQWNKQIYEPRHVQTWIRISGFWSLMLLFLKKDMVSGVCQIFIVGVSEITCQSFVCTLRECVILGLGLPSLRAGSVSIPHSVDK
jgi:hypothetical protein